jgi:hypothetical protein
VRRRRELSTEEYLTRANRRGPRWVLPVMVALVLLLGLAVSFIYYRNFGVKEIDAKVKTFHATDHNISITFETTRKDPNRALDCVLRARVRSGETVATLDVTVPAGAKQTTLTREFATPSHAIIGEVESCAYAAG